MSDPQVRLAEALSDRYTLEREVGAGGDGDRSRLLYYRVPPVSLSRLRSS